jgi:hypothetical protein
MGGVYGEGVRDEDVVAPLWEVEKTWSEGYFVSVFGGRY